MSQKTREVKKNCNNSSFSDYCKSPGFSTLQESCNDRSHSKKQQNLANTYGTLPRGRKQASLTRSDSSMDSSDCQRQIIILEKQDNQTFGFEIQTYRLHTQNANALEMCTYVCKVHTESPAYIAGLKAGDVLAIINGIKTEGFSHWQIVELIKSSGNCLRLETVNGTAFKKRELETRLQFLKQTLHEKWVELQSLLLQEQRLVHENQAKCPQLSVHKLGSRLMLYDTLESGRPSVSRRNTVLSCSPRNKQRFSSDSSCKSQLSFMTEDSEDDSYQTCVFDDSASESLFRRGSVDECFFTRDNEFVKPKRTLTRNRSISLASSGSGPLSPSWDMNSSIFGTFRRKGKQGSVKRNLMKFIPGLNRAVEEEESHF
uniref:Cytohesin 1 interacting protein n=1 Tax=Latimeria chalumnae TaxID=7897 RepID=H3AF43_LATCH